MLTNREEVLGGIELLPGRSFFLFLIEKAGLSIFILLKNMYLLSLSTLVL